MIYSWYDFNPLMELISALSRYAHSCRYHINSWIKIISLINHRISSISVIKNIVYEIISKWLFKPLEAEIRDFKKYFSRKQSYLSIRMDAGAKNSWSMDINHFENWLQNLSFGDHVFWHSWQEIDSQNEWINIIYSEFGLE